MAYSRIAVNIKLRELEWSHSVDGAHRLHELAETSEGKIIHFYVGSVWSATTYTSKGPGIKYYVSSVRNTSVTRAPSLEAGKLLVEMAYYSMPERRK